MQGQTPQIGQVQKERMLRVHLARLVNAVDRIEANNERLRRLVGRLLPEAPGDRTAPSGPSGAIAGEAPFALAFGCAIDHLDQLDANTQSILNALDGIV